MTRPQIALLRKAHRQMYSPPLKGWFVTLMRSEARTAQALERNGLGTYHRTIDGDMCFVMNDAGREAIK